MANVKTWAKSGGRTAGRKAADAASKRASAASAHAYDNYTAAAHDAAAKAHREAHEAYKKAGSPGLKSHQQIAENHENEAAIIRDRENQGFMADGTQRKRIADAARQLTRPNIKPEHLHPDDRKRDEQGRFA